MPTSLPGAGAPTTDASSPRLERGLWVLASAAFLIGAAHDRLPWLRGPAPYPPEWQWPLHEDVASGPVGPLVLLAALGLALLAVSGTAAARARPRTAARALLALGTVAGLALPVAVLAREPDGAMATLFGRVAYRTATSYYTVALSPEAADPLAFLRRHHELLADFRKGAKHAATHPPGPVLVYRGLLALCDRAPALTRTVLEASGVPDSNPRRPRPEHLPPARAAAILGGLLILVASVLTAWPIAGLARHLGCGPLAASRLGILWTMLPGPVVMLPQFDQALALPVAFSALALFRALAAEARAAHAVTWTVAAGLTGGLALGLSYGAAAFLAITGMAVLAASIAQGVPPRRALLRAAAAATVTALAFLAPALAGHHPIASAAEALRIHREFFTRPRDYALWLAFDPLDLAVFLGPPIAVSLVLTTVRALRRRAARSKLTPDDGFRLGATAALALLLLSGQTRGEVGRIWIPIMPVLLVSALARPSRGGGEAEGDPSAWSAVLLGACVLPVTVAIATWWRFF